ncbi:MAG: type II toxin-antitoxin system VapC family toxin [Acidimicrobiia bacterium]|nr:type II toxin-antitoxin system VapC family toxin [Acidimicrobiia bacterium]
MSRVFFDTNLFIYLIEQVQPQHDRVRDILFRMRERDDELSASTLTLGELLVKPIAAGDESLSAKYESLLHQSVSLIPFDAAAARTYARIRQDRSIKAPDAIQLSCAASAGTDLFVTNDERLSRKTIPGIQFVTSLDRAFL